jgi:hypothetical protein
VTHPVEDSVTTCGSMELTLHPGSRLVVLRFVTDTSLTGDHGVALVGAMRRVIGAPGERFALLADCKGAHSTDADYRASTGDFFLHHRDTARIALFNLGPIIRVVADMFRVGIGLQLKTFTEHAAARAWLRKEGIDA